MEMLSDGFWNRGLTFSRDRGLHRVLHYISLDVMLCAHFARQVPERTYRCLACNAMHRGGLLRRFHALFGHSGGLANRIAPCRQPIGHEFSKPRFETA